MRSVALEGLGCRIVQRLRRAVWPSLHEPDADRLARQGFWICTALAAYQVCNWWGHASAAGATLSFSFYFVGACGVRSRSWVAAALLLAWQLLGQFGDLVLGLPLHLSQDIITVLLALTVRTTWIAAKHRVPPECCDLAATFPPHVGFVRAADGFALELWKWIRWPYLVVAISLIVLSTVGTVEAVHDPGSGVAIEDGMTRKR